MVEGVRNQNEKGVLLDASAGAAGGGSMNRFDAVKKGLGCYIAQMEGSCAKIPSCADCGHYDRESGNGLRACIDALELIQQFETIPSEWTSVKEKLPEPDSKCLIYLFLTKNPARYIDLSEKGLLPSKHWYGYTATCDDDLWTFHHADDCPVKNLFVSVEPIHDRLITPFSTHCPADWVIIGAETGNCKNKIIPKRSWITEIADHCEMMTIPVFMKESVKELMGSDFKQQFPWEVLK